MLQSNIFHRCPPCYLSINHTVPRTDCAREHFVTHFHLASFESELINFGTYCYHYICYHDLKFSLILIHFLALNRIILMQFMNLNTNLYFNIYEHFMLSFTCADISLMYIINSFNHLVCRCSVSKPKHLFSSSFAWVYLYCYPNSYK